MSNERKLDVIDQAVAFIREHYRERGHEIGNAHAHAAVSHYLGYKSKVALKSDTNFDATDTQLIAYRETSIPMLLEHIPLMKPTPLQGLNMRELGAVIYSGLAPACECCDQKSLSITPLGYEDSEPDGWVCQPCASDEDEEYAQCKFCGDGYVYRASEINHRGECAEHNGESEYDDEELEDMESYLEYLQNH